MGKFLRNCRLCQRPMESSPFMMCATCLKDSDKVRNFSVKHPYVSVEEIAQETQVSFAKVNNMVKLGLNKKDVKTVK
ncbi:hypothetical protein [Lentibacillus sp. Marseille-P4043]|uniref:hypothetical protein n=1 Tax=Lentibacillus sp. Marseille-P4043 TaxID=2040293 RepID=UPI000D0BD3EB|nr:hypothetical protein [Lentibacillus sp. Marseille-P4043]